MGTKEPLYQLSFWIWKLVFFNRVRTLLGWEHNCAYTLVDTVIDRQSPRKGGIPLTAWVYKCWCGREIVEINESGAELLAQGVPYDRVVGTGEYATNRVSEGYEERHRSTTDKQE